MEGVAHREAEREELHKEMAGVELRLLQRRQQLREVEQQQRQASDSARSEAQELANKRKELFQQIEEVKYYSEFLFAYIFTLYSCPFCFY
jgi:predicted  nucleic acid-binding Zn-ribbon protein